jgi:hypothetical protein
MLLPASAPAAQHWLILVPGQSWIDIVSDLLSQY